LVLPDTTRPQDFGLYVHWPFCQAKCPYCDFNSHVAARVDHDRWLSAYVSEIKRISEETGPRLLRSIFFGGGTPSLMKPETVSAILDAARQGWSIRQRYRNHA
jgi:coproporphyrinogen III oxidase-like Fe-S oxidoreductase